MLGGVFYLLSWLLVSGFSGAWTVYPLVSTVLAGLFFGLMLLRVLIRRNFEHRPQAVNRGMQQQWAVLLSTAALWGGVGCWTLLDPVFDAALTLSLLATVSLATAFAQVFAVHAPLAMLGTGMLYLPLLATVLWRGDQAGVALVLILNLMYLVAVIGRSHREYAARLQLDEALRLERDRFARQSRMDSLTGLSNRGDFQEKLGAQLQASVVSGELMALLIIDLDHFKAINDRYGHLAGDQCLRETAGLLEKVFGSSDCLIARLGGEEFGVLVVGAGCADLAKRAERFRSELAQHPMRLEAGTAFHLTCSIGLAHYAPDLHRGSDALYAAADQALYRAKRAGRNRLETASVG